MEKKGRSQYLMELSLFHDSSSIHHAITSQPNQALIEEEGKISTHTPPNQAVNLRKNNPIRERHDAEENTGKEKKETEGRWMNCSPQSQALDLPTVTDLFTFSSFSACICHLLSSLPPLPSSPSAVRKQAAPSPVLLRKSEFTSGQRRRRCCFGLSRTDDSYIHFYLEEKEGTAI